MTLQADLPSGEALFKGPCVFAKGVTRIEDLPADGRPEVAFAGRSNVGKSSLINALTGQKALARVSVTPGRTRELNYFTLGKEGELYLVDMPGYGYARAAKSEIKGWTRLIRDYLRGRRELKRVFLLDRRAPRHQTERHRDDEAARRSRGLLPGGADQGRQAKGNRACRRSGEGRGDARQAPGSLPCGAHDLGAHGLRAPRAPRGCGCLSAGRRGLTA